MKGLLLVSIAVLSLPFLTFAQQPRMLSGPTTPLVQSTKKSILRRVTYAKYPVEISFELTGQSLSRRKPSALLVAGSFWINRDTTRAILQNVEAGQQSPTIIVTPQQDAPLEVLSTWIESSKPKDFRFVGQFQNKSGKGIRAYGIKSQTVTSKQQNGHLQFMNLRWSIWQSTEIRTIEFADSQEDQISTVRLTVDFVEFTDGTTWGSDSLNSRDMLAGQREGAKVERQRLRALLQAKGDEALVNDLQKSGAPVEPSKENRSAHWAEGYLSGVASVRRRLGQTLASGNKEQIKAELSKPFDSSEEDHK